MTYPRLSSKTPSDTIGNHEYITYHDKYPYKITILLINISINPNIYTHLISTILAIGTLKKF